MLTNDFYNHSSSTQFSKKLFFHDLCSLNTHTFVILFWIMDAFTSTMLTKVVGTFNSITYFNFIILFILSLKIFCISLNWGQLIILCSIIPQIWQGYFKGFSWFCSLGYYLCYNYIAIPSFFMFRTTPFDVIGLITIGIIHAWPFFSHISLLWNYAFRNWQITTTSVSIFFFTK